MKKISIFASGSGSNAQKIVDYFKSNPKIKIDSLICNNPKAKVLDRALDWGCDSFLINKTDFKNEEYLVGLLKERNTDLIVLAGFLWLIPSFLIQEFPNKIVNIHPALLPKYGGKGMHGSHVHQAVFNAGEIESGISIHYINEEYDKGAIIHQEKCLIKGLNPEEIAAKVLELEHRFFPIVIDQILSNA